MEIKYFSEFVNESNVVNKKALQTFEEFFKTFDINSIPEIVRDKSYIDYSDIFDFLNKVDRFRNVDENFNYIHESSDEPSSIEKVVNKLVNQYNVDQTFSIRVYDSYGVKIVKVDKIPQYSQTTFSVMVPLIENNLRIISTELDACGYYEVAKHNYVDDRGKQWSFMIFDPKVQNTITEQLKDQYMYLYHCSPSSNDDSIMKNGIIPNNSKGFYNFNEKRVYLHYYSPTSSDFKKIMQKVVSNRKKTIKNYDTHHIVYVISLKKLPKDIEFFQYPHADAVFTTSVIPTSAIVDKDEIDFN